MAHMKKGAKKVYVGLSGGVDSAVSALLLKQSGYDVTGVFIKAWSPFSDIQSELPVKCSWKEDRRSAMKVCAILNINFETLDLEKDYKQNVVDYMIKEYELGRTPNPDVMCNKEIKFGLFLDWAKKQGADFVATGHYARVDKFEDKFILKEGVDKNKDQSYFLWTLTQDQLSHTMFPIGKLKKRRGQKNSIKK
jgi:tRNA-specific 2-thiouridylase